jgi:CheY-like chemotaxis protein
LVKLKSIFLVDDDEGINFLNKTILKRIAAADQIFDYLDPLMAFQALTDAKQIGLLPELIFLDINMPLMDGWQFIDRMKSLKISNQTTKIILLSSSIDPADQSRADCIKEIEDFRSKPLTLDLAQNLISSLFGN